jgi:hypothetical protein
MALGFTIWVIAIGREMVVYEEQFGPRRALMNI